MQQGKTGMGIFPINKDLAVFESKTLAFNMCLRAYIKTGSSEEMKANIFWNCLTSWCCHVISDDVSSTYQNHSSENRAVNMDTISHLKSTKNRCVIDLQKFDLFSKEINISVPICT